MNMGFIHCHMPEGWGLLQTTIAQQPTRCFSKSYQYGALKMAATKVIKTMTVHCLGLQKYKQ